jgi:hypothetical protein
MTLQHEQYARAWASGFVEGRRGVFVPLALIDVCEGNFYDAILLAQIVYWCTPGASGETKLRRRYEGELWIAKRHHEWYDETRVKEGTARACLRRLRAKGLIHYTLVGKGNDATPYLRVDWEGLGRALQALGAREEDDAPDAHEDESEVSHVRQDPVSEPKNNALPDKFDTRLSCDDTRLSCGDTPQTCPSYIAKNTYKENSITTPPTTHHASRDRARGVAVEGAASAKKGNKAKATSKGATEKADTEQAASKPYTTEDYQALVEAIPKLLEVSPALARRYATLLLGTAKTGEWRACKLETPVLVDELRAFIAYYRARYPELSLPKTPRALHQHIHDFRREREAQARAAQMRKARDKQIANMYSEEEARKVREMLEAGVLCTTKA